MWRVTALILFAASACAGPAAYRTQRLPMLTPTGGNFMSSVSTVCGADQYGAQVRHHQGRSSLFLEVNGRAVRPQEMAKIDHMLSDGYWVSSGAELRCASPGPGAFVRMSIQGGSARSIFFHLSPSAQVSGVGRN